MGAEEADVISGVIRQLFILFVLYLCLPERYSQRCYTLGNRLSGISKVDPRYRPGNQIPAGEPLQQWSLLVPPKGVFGAAYENQVRARKQARKLA
ncbi:MAG TPA: hypothetical protein VFQ41_01365 [Candidatus Angelobacter sp.]|nr:hypothetical protein [Candidatus Angelobacter sp.]